MARFASDVDILKYEPVLFGELHLPWQVQASGTGAVLSGTTLTAGDANFTAAGIEAGGVIYLRSSDGALDGAYEIVSVDSATQLTVSVLRADTTAPAIAPPTGSEISYRISTLAPQATEAAFELTEHFGIQPGDPTSEVPVESIVSTEGLRRTSALAVIAGVIGSGPGARQDALPGGQSVLYSRSLKGQATVPRERGSGLRGRSGHTRVGGVARLIRD